MIKAGNIYKHKNSMDVAFLFDTFLGEDESHYKFSGRWLNVGLKSPAFIFNSIDMIKIQKGDVDSWEIMK